MSCYWNILKEECDQNVKSIVWCEDTKAMIFSVAHYLCPSCWSLGGNKKLEPRFLETKLYVTKTALDWKKKFPAFYLLWRFWGRAPLHNFQWKTIWESIFMKVCWPLFTLHGLLAHSGSCSSQHADWLVYCKQPLRQLRGYCKHGDWTMKAAKHLLC